MAKQVWWGKGISEGEAWGLRAGRKAAKRVLRWYHVGFSQVPRSVDSTAAREVRLANEYSGCSGMIRRPAGVGTV